MITRYSQLLEKRINASGYKPRELAELTGIDRSYIVKNKTGRAVIHDVKKAEKLFGLLQQTDAEYQELFTAYLEAHYGEERFKEHNAVLKFISCFKHEPSLTFSIQNKTEIPKVSYLSETEDIFCMIQLVFCAEKAKEKGHIRVIAQPDRKRLMGALKDVLRGENNTQMEQIICLDKLSENHRNGYVNITTYSYLVPIILNKRSSSYTAYSYYDDVSAHLNRFSILPYVFITEDCVIAVDSEYTKAFVYQEAEIIAHYQEVFDSMKQECDILYHSVNDEGSMLNRIVDMPFPSGSIFYMGPQPCLGALDTGNLYEKYAVDVPEVRALVMQLKKKKISDYAAYVNGTLQITAFFTKEGIRRLIYEGRTDEIPREIYHPISRTDACNLIRQILKFAESGRYHPYLVDEKKFAYPPGLIIDIYDRENIDLLFNAQDRNKRLWINEKSISSLIYEFMDKFSESHYVYSEEETIKWLKEEIERAEKTE